VRYDTGIVRVRILCAVLAAVALAGIVVAVFTNFDYTVANAVIAAREVKGAARRILSTMQSNRGAVAATLTVTPGGPGGLQNGLEYAASFRPYGATSVWNRRVSDHPAIAPFSEAVVSHQFPSGKNDGPFRSVEAGKWDYGHPIFYASPSDPLVHTRCNQYCGTFPAQIRIPAKARPAGGSDAHFDIIQPDGTEISMWATYGTPGRDWQTGDTVTAGNISNCGSFFTGPGTIFEGAGPTAGGACLRAGQITAAELLAGHIDHALFAIGACAQGRQYPAPPEANTHACTSGIGPPLGGREWYDVPCETTQANSSLQPWEKAILCALHDYGAYMEDTNDRGRPYFVGIGVYGTESIEQAFDYGQPDPFAALASQGWTSLTIPDVDKHGTARQRWVGADVWNPPGVDFPRHIHWLAPCSAQGTC
jgi:hypothetical protein